MKIYVLDRKMWFATIIDYNGCQTVLLNCQQVCQEVGNRAI